MTKKDPKKIEHSTERHEISEDIVAIRNLKSVSQEKKNEIIAELLAKKEDTETKLLRFEKDNFRIDTTGRKERKWLVLDRHNKTSENALNKRLPEPDSIKVKRNATKDVVEYLEGPAKGEQIFITYDAFIREICKDKKCSKEEVEKKYLMTMDEFEEKMKDKPKGSDAYKNFFNKEIKSNQLAGYFDPTGEGYRNVFNRVYNSPALFIWLAGGDVAVLEPDGWYFYKERKGEKNYFSKFGFSGRLLKR